MVPIDGRSSRKTPALTWAFLIPTQPPQPVSAGGVLP